MIGIHVTFGLTVGLLLILSVFLFMGKGTILINGVMFLPKEARDRINKKALGRFVSLMLIITNISLILMWLDVAWLETNHFWLTWVATGVLLVAIIILSIIGILKREKWFGFPGSNQSQ